MYISERKKIYDTVYEYKDGFGLWCLTPLSTIFHLKYMYMYMKDTCYFIITLFLSFISNTPWTTCSLKIRLYWAVVRGTLIVLPNNTHFL